MHTQPVSGRSVLAFAAVVVGAGLLAGCAGSDNASSDDTSSAPDIADVADTSEELSGDPNATAFHYLQKQGLSKREAAAIVGNFDQESSMNPSVHQYGGGPGRGIAQWSAGGRWNADNHDNVAWFAARRHRSMTSLKLQLDFTLYELNHFGGYGLRALRNAGNLHEAVAVFAERFEACGQCDMTNRYRYAQEAYNHY